MKTFLKKNLQNKESNEDKGLTAVIEVIARNEKQQDKELTQQKKLGKMISCKVGAKKSSLKLDLKFFSTCLDL